MAKQLNFTLPEDVNINVEQLFRDALYEFMSSRTPAASYVAQRYKAHNMDLDKQSKKTREVMSRIFVAQHIIPSMTYKEI